MFLAKLFRNSFKSSDKIIRRKETLYVDDLFIPILFIIMLLETDF